MIGRGFVSKYVIVADSGSDLKPDAIERYGIAVTPMHVTVGEETMDDGEISPLEIYGRCREMGVMPKTSACTPGDFNKVFDRVHAEQPDATILYLAYSAITTCTYQSAQIAAEGRDYVRTFDTRIVSVGLGRLIVMVARYIEEHPDASVEDIFSYADSVSARVLLGFVPTDLAFLKAGGRLSNAAFLGAHLLKIKPCIEVIDGEFVATKKFRGSMLKASRAFLDHMVAQGDIDYSYIGLGYSMGLSEELRGDMETYARDLGFREIEWTQVGSVISCHCGPTAFGGVLFKKE